VRAPNLPLTEQQLDTFYRNEYRGLSNATIKHVADSYHFIMYDQPERFAKEVRLFLAQ
jgi:pimeloyl-ACP methyl ester carboxylesterase